MVVFHLNPAINQNIAGMGLHECSSFDRSIGESPLTVTYRTVGKLDLQADIFLPPGKESYPVILWIHGGALIFGDRNMLPSQQCRRYLQSGFAVVSIDYRLAPETKLPEILTDLDSAHKWILQNGPSIGLDTSRFAVVGHSAGGYLSLMAGIRFRPHPDAIVSFYGYGDVAGEWYSRPDSFYLQTPMVSRKEAMQAVGSVPLANGDEATRFQFYRYTRQQGQWPQFVTGLDPAIEPSAFDSFCPVRNVTDEYPPTLLLHGNRDTDVPIARSAEMADQFMKNGVDFEFLILQDRGHVFDIEGDGLNDPEVHRAFDHVISFLKKHMNEY
jgi:acetyl esterase/lipase